jgi:Na+-translocating ferredoxin:NAD+ oxidoreductase RnfG subunit
MPCQNWPHLVAVAVIAAVTTPALATDYLSVPDAQHILFPQALHFVPLPVTLTPPQISQIKKLSGVPQRTNQPRIWRAMQEAAIIGWVLVDEVIGKHEFITYATAISPDGHVLGVEILSYRESHGGQVRDANWRSRFRGKTLADPFRLNQDIPNISGATLSSRNITDGVKRLLAIHALVLAHSS